MSSPRVTRRRGAVLESAIFAAVWAELAAAGYQGVTFSGVATRAGTSKPVLYRRWANRARLVFAALASTHRTLPEPDTGSLRGDLLAVMTNAAAGTTMLRPEAVWGLLAESADEPDFAASVRNELVDVLPAQMAATIVARAEERGELIARRRSPRELTLPFDLMRNEFFARGRIDVETIEAILDDVALPLLRG